MYYSEIWRKIPAVVEGVKDLLQETEWGERR